MNAPSARVDGPSPKPRASLNSMYVSHSAGDNTLCSRKAPGRSGRMVNAPFCQRHAYSRAPVEPSVPVPVTWPTSLMSLAMANEPPGSVPMSR